MGWPRPGRRKLPPDRPDVQRGASLAYSRGNCFVLPAYWDQHTSHSLRPHLSCMSVATRETFDSLFLLISTLPFTIHTLNMSPSIPSKHSWKALHQIATAKFQVLQSLFVAAQATPPAHEICLHLKTQQRTICDWRSAHSDFHKYSRSSVLFISIFQSNAGMTFDFSLPWNSGHKFRDGSTANISSETFTEFPYRQAHDHTGLFGTILSVAFREQSWGYMIKHGSLPLETRNQGVLYTHIAIPFVTLVHEASCSAFHHI